MTILEKILTYFEVKLAALILKKVALDSAATALAFKITRANIILVQYLALKKITTFGQLKYQKRFSKNIRYETIPNK